MYKNFLFDLDGTLLPLDMDEFIKLYMASLCKKMIPKLKIPSDTLVDAIWKGMAAMYKNDNTASNEDVFWSAANKVCGMDLSKYTESFEDYYLTDFSSAKHATDFNPYAKRCVNLIKAYGGRLIVATNPIFPEVATLRRLSWAGLSGNDFELITCYENSGYCKPNLKYYQMICDKCNIDPKESIMIGNDVDEDMCSSELGFDTYLITDCLINRQNKDYSMYKNGSFEDFYNFLTDSFK